MAPAPLLFTKKRLLLKFSVWVLHRSYYQSKSWSCAKWALIILATIEPLGTEKSG
jgi:hypothetical protein